MPDAVASSDWTDREIGLIVADYFDMLALELASVARQTTDWKRQEHIPGTSVTFGNCE